MKNYYNAVKEMLTEYPETRDDDMLLYARFCYKYEYVTSGDSFMSVMCNAKINKLPSFESVTRARRKVQENEPSLLGKRYRDRRREEIEYVNFYSAS